MGNVAINGFFYLDLLITAFISLLVAWVVMVTPHTYFVDYVNKGQTFGFSIVLWSEVHEVEYNLIEAGILVSSPNIFSKIGLKKLKRPECRLRTVIFQYLATIFSHPKILQPGPRNLAKIM